MIPNRMTIDLNEEIVYSVISLKQRSTCRYVTYFDTNTYVILFHKHKMEERTIERKTKRRSFFYYLTIYMGGQHISERGDVQSFYHINNKNRERNERRMSEIRTNVFVVSSPYLRLALHFCKRVQSLYDIRMIRDS